MRYFEVEMRMIIRALIECLREARPVSRLPGQFSTFYDMAQCPLESAALALMRKQGAWL